MSRKRKKSSEIIDSFHVRNIVLIFYFTATEKRGKTDRKRFIL